MAAERPQGGAEMARPQGGAIRAEEDDRRTALQGGAGGQKHPLAQIGAHLAVAADTKALLQCHEQRMIRLGPAPELDGRQVRVGKALEGIDQQPPRERRRPLGTEHPRQAGFDPTGLRGLGKDQQARRGVLHWP